MNNNIFWIFEITLKDGQLENLKSIMSEMVKNTNEKEPETMAYEWTISSDEKICHIHERYSNSEATVNHLKSFIENYANRLMMTGDATRFEVYGNPSAEAKNILDGFQPVYMTPIGGFIR